MANSSAMTQPLHEPESAAPGWFVHTAGHVWGPYSPVRVARFVAEGRVTPESLVAAEIDGPFHPAGRWRCLAPLFSPPNLYHHQPAPIPEAQPVSQPTPSAPSKPEMQPAPSPKLDTPEPSPSTAPTRPLLVCAGLTSLTADLFEALLGRYGAVVAVRPTVWLVQARCDPATLRNAVSRRLTGADALVIVHAPLDQAAWFNLDSAAERRLREVWAG